MLRKYIYNHTLRKYMYDYTRTLLARLSGLSNAWFCIFLKNFDALNGSILHKTQEVSNQRYLIDKALVDSRLLVT